MESPESLGPRPDCFITHPILTKMEDDDQLTAYIIQLIEEHHGTDLAEAEFKRFLADDQEMRNDYRDWCDEHGYTMRNGFRDFADEYTSSRDAIWESLEDYDNSDE